MPVELIHPDWPAPPRVRTLVTTRHGGVSPAPWDSLNLGDHVGDAPESVAENRRRLRFHLPAEPLWLRQVHGTRCVDAATAAPATEADAAFSRTSNIVCAVLTADCLPILLCDEAGTVVAAAHAGWRGLAAGVIEATLTAMATPADRLMAWLGPAIGPESFEVGDEVRAAFITQDAQAAQAFVSCAEGKWLCDLYGLARLRLAALGVRHIAGADNALAAAGSSYIAQPDSLDAGRRHFCTARETERFFSYRRDGVTGRMASLIWLE